MSHNSEDLTIKENTPIAAPLDCQTTANLRNLLGSLLLGRLFSPEPRLFSPLSCPNSLRSKDESESPTAPSDDT